MTSRERFGRMYEHKEADRVPIIDIPWDDTLARWRREGMPPGVSMEDFFGLDHVVRICVDNSPQYEQRVVSETDEEITTTNAWGATLRNWKHATSTPEFLDFTIKDRASWERAKARMTPDRDRVDWAYLKDNYASWRDKGYWIYGELWFGFDVTHSWAVGTERVLMAMMDEPDWVMDMFNHYLDISLALMDMAWEAGYVSDAVTWYDDMGYKHNQFFSVKTYRELLKPVHKRAIDWAHAKGIKAHLHSCGDINPFVPELIEIGLDALNPLEVKAGMDPVKLKQSWGDRLVLHGGVNAMKWDDIDAIEAEIHEKLPRLKESGGYIFSSDHSVPSSVSLENFRRIVALAKSLGAY